MRGRAQINWQNIFVVFSIKIEWEKSGNVQTMYYEQEENATPQNQHEKNTLAGIE